MELYKFLFCLWLYSLATFPFVYTDCTGISAENCTKAQTCKDSSTGLEYRLCNIDTCPIKIPYKFISCKDLDFSAGRGKFLCSKCVECSKVGQPCIGNQDCCQNIRDEEGASGKIPRLNAGYCGKNNKCERKSCPGTNVNICSNPKLCSYPDTASGATVMYKFCFPDVNSQCPISLPAKASICTVVDYKLQDECFRCEKCSTHGNACERHDDCCQSYALINAFSGTNRVALNGHCVNKQCRACVNNNSPCDYKVTPKLPCCGLLHDAGKDVIDCRYNTVLRQLTNFPQLYPYCAPNPCDETRKKALDLFFPRCYGYGNIEKRRRYSGVNFCNCPKENDKHGGYKCVTNQCIGCAIQGERCGSSKYPECCDNHLCVKKKFRKSYCVQTCALQGQICTDKPSGTNGVQNCCNGLKCAVNVQDETFNFCQVGDCTEEGRPCENSNTCCKDLTCKLSTRNDAELVVFPELKKLCLK